ncbi:hypothetical protein H2200_012854 [Cladophialophora chaetospira]|uniref:DUF521 domain protein n=1 Tax=Cladophialophora chaetospira TaxID=386627 RepID=A0AA39CBZ6_9EURO|nr:hypothetical protein H2200_012854 [Cladophialophora chaetospira]
MANLIGTEDDTLQESQPETATAMLRALARSSEIYENVTKYPPPWDFGDGSISSDPEFPWRGDFDTLQMAMGWSFDFVFVETRDHFEEMRWPGGGGGFNDNPMLAANTILITGECMRFRTTSHLEDEPICFATLVGQDPADVLSEKTIEGRMRVVASKMKHVPTQILFSPRPRLDVNGLRWAPLSFRSTATGKGYSPGVAMATVADVTPGGLLVKLSGILLDVHPRETLGQEFLVKYDSAVLSVRQNGHITYPSSRSYATRFALLIRTNFDPFSQARVDSVLVEILEESEDVFATRLLAHYFVGPLNGTLTENIQQMTGTIVQGQRWCNVARDVLRLKHTKKQEKDDRYLVAGDRVLSQEKGDVRSPTSLRGCEEKAMRIQGRSLVDGTAAGHLLVTDTSLSFWGGIDSETGIIIDRHHPLHGECVESKIFSLPSGRGSCTGSGVLLELLLRKRGPAALVFRDVEEILTLGVVVARRLFGISIPVLVVSNDDFSALRGGHHVDIVDSVLSSGLPGPVNQILSPSSGVRPNRVKLTAQDRRLLAGELGPAAELAMKILIDVAVIEGAVDFLSVSQAHIDACIYIGPASLEFANRFLVLGAKFAVPTTLNAISIDQRRWREIGMNPVLAVEADKLAEAYMSMGAVMSFTCAPYLLETAPEAGENIGWAESNAVVFANSVLGARTQKYPDFMDVCIALTGRAPASGCHLEEHRLPKMKLDVTYLPEADDSFWPLLGYHAGKFAGSKIPILCGLETTKPSVSDLKAFGAAFATTSSAPMFHISGITPEANKAILSHRELPCHPIGRRELKACWEQLNTATDISLGLVSLGNPHFSVEEFAQLAFMCSGRRKHSKVQMMITTSRAVCEKAAEAGYIDHLESFGARIITDTCWCMLGEPVVPIHAKNIMTNSAKYAHYAPGMVQRGVHFGNLTSCVDAACKGEALQRIPDWLLS